MGTAGGSRRSSKTQKMLVSEGVEGHKQLNVRRQLTLPILYMSTVESTICDSINTHTQTGSRFLFQICLLLLLHYYHFYFLMFASCHTCQVLASTRTLTRCKAGSFLTCTFDLDLFS